MATSKVLPCGKAIFPYLSFQARTLTKLGSPHTTRENLMMMKPTVHGNFITHTENHTLSHAAYSFFKEVVVDAYTRIPTAIS